MTEDFSPCPYCQQQLRKGEVLTHIGEDHPAKLGKFVSEDDKLMWASLRKRKHEG
jgi:hypothetical protein